jgi:hypothetical protein
VGGVSAGRVEGTARATGAGGRDADGSDLPNVTGGADGVKGEALGTGLGADGIEAADARGAGDGATDGCAGTIGPAPTPDDGAAGDESPDDGAREAATVGGGAGLGGATPPGVPAVEPAAGVVGVDERVPAGADTTVVAGRTGTDGAVAGGRAGGTDGD